MFWKKNKTPAPFKQDNFPHPYRFCDLMISDNYQEVLFIPWGKMSEGIYTEVDNIIVDTWPCKFDDLITNIELALARFLPSITDAKSDWPSYEKSKAKSQRSYETDYIRLRLETDMTGGYGEHEVERIKINAQPTTLQNNYSLVGVGHLSGTKVAEIVIDIVEGCMKIRNY